MSIVKNRQTLLGAVIDNSEEYRNKIDASPYAIIGKTAGTIPGFLREYRIPKKVVVLGNSITQHGYREADGIEWTVGDMREMAATTPTSGWVSKVYKYLHDHVNESVEMWKSNASAWETKTNGERSYDAHMAGITGCCKMNVDGCDYFPNMTIGELLTEDVDVIIVQLSENCSIPNDKASINAGAKDFARLFFRLHQLCPNAYIYAFTGFWQNRPKTQAIITACRACSVQPIQLMTFAGPSGSTVAEVMSSVGTEIFDGNGVKIATVSGAVASHPGDLGFSGMAVYALYALYNALSYKNDEQRIIFSVKSGYNIEHPGVGEIYYRDSAATIDEFSTNYNSLLDLLILPGVYRVTIPIPPSGPQHESLVVDWVDISTSSWRSYTSVDDISPVPYVPTNQTLISHNNGTYAYNMVRTTMLAADYLEFGPWGRVVPIPNIPAAYQDIYSADMVKTDKVLFGKPVYRQCIKLADDLEIVNNNWTTIGQFSSPPVQIFNAFRIPPGFRDFTNASSNRIRVHCETGSKALKVAMWDNGAAMTLVKDTIIVIEFTIS